MKPPVLKVWDVPPRVARHNVLKRVAKKKYSDKLKYPPKDIISQNILANELIEWALKEDSLLLPEFPLSKMMSPFRFFNLAKKKENSYFTDAVDFARELLGVRVQHSINKKTMDKDLGLKILPLYCREYRDYVMESRKPLALTDSHAPILQPIIPIYTTEEVKMCAENKENE